jgi:hypothetical protein
VISATSLTPAGFLLAISSAMKAEPATTMPRIESALEKIARREQYHFLNHKGIELRSSKFVRKGRVEEVPEAAQSRMEVVRIISYNFNEFENKAISSLEIVHDVLSFSRLTHLRRSLPRMPTT